MPFPEPYSAAILARSLCLPTMDQIDIPDALLGLEDVDIALPGGAGEVPPQIDLGGVAVVDAALVPADGAVAEVPAAPAAPAAPARAPFAWRSREHAQHAQKARMKRAAERREDNAKRAKEAAETKLTGIASLLPGAANLVGSQKATAIGRKKDIRPENFAVAVHAAHLPSSTRLAVGVKFKRLQAACARLILRRQQLGLQRLLSNCHAATTQAMEAPGGGIAIHLNYQHVWDGVDVKVHWIPDKGYQLGFRAISTPTMVQRGCVTYCIAERAWTETETYSDQWITQPQEVSGTKASHTYPALVKSWPSALWFNKDAMEALLQQVASVTLSPMSDKAGSNVAVMKWMGQYWMEHLLHRFKGRCNFWPGTCQLHSKQRGQLALTGLKEHIARHFAVSNLLRIKSTLSHIVNALEMQCQTCKRVTGEIPDFEGPRLETIIDVFYEMGAPHHDRKTGKSRHWEAMTHLGAVCNGCLMPGTPWRHHCRVQPDTGKPCHSNQDALTDDLTVTVVNALYGGADPCPAESTWTHLTQAFKRTLMRRLLRKVGVDAWPTPEVQPREAPAPMDEDGGATQAHAKALKNSRIGKTHNYFHNDEMMWHLGVYTMGLHYADTYYLYPLFGEARFKPRDGEVQVSKLDLLMHPFQTLVGQFSQAMVDGLRNWTHGGPNRKPWCFMAVLGAPMESPEFMRWSRSQWLRLNSAMCRRFEVFLRGWPHPLIYLTWPGDEFRPHEELMLDRLFATRRENLDPYTLGILVRFPARELLQSPEARAVLTTDFNNILASDLAERLNSELVRGHPSRAPARHFTQTTRESVVNQAASVHREHGGQEPVGTNAMKPTSAKEHLLCSPLLPARGGPIAGAIADAPPVVAGGHVGGAGGHDDGQPEEHASALVPFVAPPPRFQCARMLVERPNPDPFTSTAGHSDDGSTERRGLSIMLLQRNKHLAATKAAKGSKLTADEVAQCYIEFGRIWEAQGGGAAAAAAFRAEYEDWRAQPAPVAPPVEYRPVWGGGCSSTPVSKEELFECVREVGWPSNEEVADAAGAEVKVKPDETINFLDIHFDLWGLERQARNADRRGRERTFDMIEKGFFNYITKVGKAKADAGDIMFLIEGRGPPREEGGAPSIHRELVLLTHVTYTPTVFDVTYVFFEDVANVDMVAMELPCKAVVGLRPCWLGETFEAFDSTTSDWFIEALCETCGAMELHLHVVEYDPIRDDDGSNFWSLLRGTERLGRLWAPDQATALQFPENEAAAARKAASRKQAADDKMMRSISSLDPFSEAAAAELSKTDAAKRAAADRRPRKGSAGPRHPRARAARERGPPARDDDDLIDLFYGDDGESSGAGGVDAPARRLEEIDVSDASSASSETPSEKAERLAELEEFCAAGGFDPEPPRDPSGVGVEPGCIEAAVAGAFVESAEDVGLDVPPGDADADADGAPSEDGAAAAAAAAAFAPEVVDGPALRWQDIGEPGPLGYIYIGGVSRLRIQRNTPPGRCTIRCYRHPKCELRVPLRCLGESNDEIKQWFVAVPAAAEGAPAPERKSLTERHARLGRERWKW